MMFTAIDCAYLATLDPARASVPYERLGLKVMPSPEGGRTLTVGCAANAFALRFVAPTGDGPFDQALQHAVTSGCPLVAVGLRVMDLRQAVARLETHGVRVTEVPGGALLSVQAEAGTALVLIEASARTAVGPEHSFPLRRLDHLAAVTPDLEAKTRFWGDVLGVAVSGEVVTPTLVIRQLRIGDAVLELLGPASPESPILTRPPGLVSMASWEVADLEAAIGLARSGGFTLTDPAPGPLPETRIATVQGSDLSGVNMQLLQYVK